MQDGKSHPEGGKAWCPVPVDGRGPASHADLVEADRTETRGSRDWFPDLALWLTLWWPLQYTTSPASATSAGKCGLGPGDFTSKVLPMHHDSLQAIDPEQPPWTRFEVTVSLGGEELSLLLPGFSASALEIITGPTMDTTNKATRRPLQCLNCPQGEGFHALFVKLTIDGALEKGSHSSW